MLLESEHSDLVLASSFVVVLMMLVDVFSDLLELPFYGCLQICRLS